MIGVVISSGFYFNIYCFMILNAYLQLGQHTFWNNYTGFTDGLIGDLIGVRDVLLFEYLYIGLFRLTFS